MRKLDRFLLWLLGLLACCGSQPRTASPDGLDLDLRCAEDCGSEGAVFDRVEYSVAITGEDSWVCRCMKGPETIRLW